MRTREIKTKNYFLRNCNQATIKQIFNGRINHKKYGWINIKISENLKDSIFEEIKNRLNLNEIRETKNTFNHWFFDRMFFINYGNGIKLDYSTGQDSTVEYRQVKKHLKNL
jgi:hypothetical protein